MSEDLVNDKPVRKIGTWHIPLAFVFDVSVRQIDSLNKAINNMIDKIKSDVRLQDIVDLGIFIFGEDDSNPVYQGFSAISECGHITLHANDNMTFVAESLNTAVDHLKEWSSFCYSQGGQIYKPWLILVTDGEFFDSDEDLNKVSERIRKQLNFFALGLEKCNRTQLEKLTNENEHVIEVKVANLVEYFDYWLSRLKASTIDYDGPILYEPINLPPEVFTP